MAEEYELEYGNATVEVHTTPASPASAWWCWTIWWPPGGTMMAGVKLLSRLGGEIVESRRHCRPARTGRLAADSPGRHSAVHPCVTLPATERGGKQHKKTGTVSTTVPVLFLGHAQAPVVGRRFLARAAGHIGVGGLGGGDDRGRLRRICRRLGRCGGYRDRRRFSASIRRQGIRLRDAAEPLAPRRQPTSDPASSSWAAQPVRRQVWPEQVLVNGSSTVGGSTPA